MEDVGKRFAFRERKGGRGVAAGGASRVPGSTVVFCFCPRVAGSFPPRRRRGSSPREAASCQHSRRLTLFCPLLLGQRAP